MHYRKLWLILGIIYILIIVAGSLLRVPEMNIAYDHTDKIIHFMLYFLLVGWFVQLYQHINSRLLILAGAMTLGMFIEYLQGMTAYRSFDYLDGVANSIGALSAFLLAGTAFADLLSLLDSRIYHLTALDK